MRLPLSSLLLLGLAVLFVLLAPARPARALCIGCSCNISVADNLNFGSYNPLTSGAVTTTGQVGFHCTIAVGVGSSVTVQGIHLDTGLYGTSFARKMAFGSNRINYNIYVDSSHTTIWGDGTNGTGVRPSPPQTYNGVLFLLTNIDQQYTMYGQVPGGQTTVVPGSYADTVTVTVVF